MADIEKQGGKIKLTAETLPTGHTISVGSLPSWITVDSTSSSQNWVGKVSQNENANDRSYILTGTVTTNTDPEYEGTTSLTKTWTITQAGAGSVIPEQCRFNFKFDSFAVVNNYTQYNVEFISNPGSTSFKLSVPTAEIGAGFNSSNLPTGAVTANSRDEQILRSDEGTAELVVNREDTDAYVGVGYIFEGPQAGSGNFTVTLNVIFHNKTDTTIPSKTVSLVTGQTKQENFYDWFNSDGEVDIEVSFSMAIN